jgi:hypothetical protein
MKRLIVTLIGFICLTFSVMSLASLAGKPLILVHGFQFDVIQNPSTDEGFLQQRSEEYFNEFWTSRAEVHHFWPSSERVSGGIKDQFRRHFQALENSGLCIDGCVWLTHSSGDLVLRDALSRLGQWGIDRDRVKVLAVLDIAGAGGGTELADLAVDVSQSSGFFNSVIRNVVELFVGFNPRSQNLGVVNDLRPATARNIAINNQPFPRLRFVGTGSTFLGVTRPFLEGAGDSIVPLHSSCGARSQGDFLSCVNSIRPNGKLARTRAPASLYFNHYPILMGENTDHFEAIADNRDGSEFATVINNVSANGLVIDFDDQTRKRWWSFGARVRTLRNGNEKSLSRHIFETLDN